MQKGLGKFCRDVDRLSKELWRANHFKLELPKPGDHLILVKGAKCVKIEVTDWHMSSVPNTGTALAKVVESPLLDGEESLVGEVLSGVYTEGASVWTNKDGERYDDYRLFILMNVKEKQWLNLTGWLRKVTKANNAGISIAFTYPLSPDLFHQSCTLQDVLRWSKPKRHYISVVTTLFNAGLSGFAMLSNQSLPAVCMAVCSAICFACLHVELRRMKLLRDDFVVQKSKIDGDYLEVKRVSLANGLDDISRQQVKKVISRYHLLINEYIHPHFRGVGIGWAGKLTQAVDTMPADELFFYLDQYRDALDLPD